MSSASTHSLASSTWASVWKPLNDPVPHMSPARKKHLISLDSSVSSQSVPLARDRNTAATSSGALVSASSPCASEGKSSKVSTLASYPDLQGIAGADLSDGLVHLLPVVQPGALELRIVERKPGRRDQGQPRAGDRAEPGHVAGVGRDLRLHQHDVEPTGVEKQPL